MPPLRPWHPSRPKENTRSLSQRRDDVDALIQASQLTKQPLIHLICFGNPALAIKDDLGNTPTGYTRVETVKY